MSSGSRKGLLKSLLDSKYVWNILLGPFYNRHITKLLPEVYRELVGILDPHEGARVIDVGCGPGYFSLMLAEEYPAVTVAGLDYSSTEIKAAEKNRIRSKVKNCHFIEGDAMDLPFSDFSFDAAVSTFSIKHWPDSERGLEEMFRVLKPGGVALLSEMNKDCTESEFETFYRKVRSIISWYLRLPTTKWFIRSIIVEKGVSVREVKAAALSAGFEEVSADRYEGLPLFMLRLKKK